MLLYIGKNLMVRSKYKFVEKSKIPIIVIDGQKGIEQDSAEWYYFSWEKRYFDFLAVNNLNLEDIDFMFLE